MSKLKRPIEREQRFLTKNRWRFGMNLFSASTRSQFYFGDHIGEKDLKLGACCVRDLKVLKGAFTKINI